MSRKKKKRVENPLFCLRKQARLGRVATKLSPPQGKTKIDKKTKKQK